MHASHIPDEILARSRARRGRVEVFDALDPARTALVVIDMQRYFMDPSAVIAVPAARGIVANINRLAAAVRAAGGPVFWTRHSFVCEWTAWYGVLAQGAFADAMVAASAPQAPGYAIDPAMDVRPEDTVLHKTHYSAMLPEGCDLARHLARRGCDTLIVTGILTNVCCESTARDAMMMNYRVVFVADANATCSDAEHNATLAAIVQVVGDVRTSDAVIGLLQAGAAAAAAE